MTTPQQQEYNERREREIAMQTYDTLKWIDFPGFGTGRFKDPFRALSIVDVTRDAAKLLYDLETVNCQGKMLTISQQAMSEMKISQCDDDSWGWIVKRHHLNLLQWYSDEDFAPNLEMVRVAPAEQRQETDWPVFKCDVLVKAIKLRTIYFDLQAPEKVYQAVPVDNNDGADWVQLSQEFMEEFKVMSKGKTDFGYLVLDNENKLSWMPTETFEKGFNLLCEDG